MSEVQTRILWILIAALVLESIASPLFRKTFSGIAHGDLFAGIDKKKPLAEQLSTPAVALIAYGISMIILLAIADAVPTIATWLAVLILVYIAFKNVDLYIGFLDLGTKVLQSTKGQ